MTLGVQLLPPGTRHILWLDPGTTTGWALYYVDTATIMIDQYEFTELCHRLEGWCSTAGSSTVLGCERFVITPQSGRYPASYDALYAIGAAQSAARRHNVLAFTERQTSSTAKSFATDEIMKAVGWHRTTLVHGTDAARHVFTHLAVHGITPSEALDSMGQVLTNGHTKQEGT